MTVYARNICIFDFLKEKKLPTLSYLPSIFKRRLSSLTKMSIEVFYNLLQKEGEKLKEKKLIFTSFRGEVTKELQINSQICDEKTVHPATFSLSVFNASAAQITIAFNLTHGYQVIYPTRYKAHDFVETALATLLSGDEDAVIFIYADEPLPKEYENIASFVNPFSLACVLTKKESSNSITIGDLEALIEERFQVRKSAE